MINGLLMLWSGARISLRIANVQTSNPGHHLRACGASLEISYLTGNRDPGFQSEMERTFAPLLSQQTVAPAVVGSKAALDRHYNKQRGALAHLRRLNFS
jgi:hypothetical protein